MIFYIYIFCYLFFSGVRIVLKEAGLEEYFVQ